jgi:hypothetical protein
LKQGFAYRTLGQGYLADAKVPEAEAWFRRSLEIFSEIQSQPELAQTLLTYGRFQCGRDWEDCMRMPKRALALFETIGATGWIEETLTAFRDPFPDVAKRGILTSGNPRNLEGPAGKTSSATLGAWFWHFCHPVATAINVRCWR